MEVMEPDSGTPGPANPPPIRRRAWLHHGTQQTPLLPWQIAFPSPKHASRHLSHSPEWCMGAL